MFPRTETRLRTMFRRSIDAAIEFATLGEYGYAPAWETAAAGSAHGVRGAAGAGGWSWPDRDERGPAFTDAPSWHRSGTEAARATLLTPASAAGRARRNTGRRSEPTCGGQPIRGRSLPKQLPRTTRQRDGLAQREQHCLTDAEPDA